MQSFPNEKPEAVVKESEDSRMFPPLARVPVHVAIIMDGNGRWARARGLSRLEGHRAGTRRVREIAEACIDFGIRILTLYTFSTENWSRPEEEVEGLFHLLEETIQKERNTILENDIRVRAIGRLADIPAPLRFAIQELEEETRKHGRLLLNFAVNYGGRSEIVDAVREIVRKGFPCEQVSEEIIAQHLYTHDLPDPDLVIRTAGEMRLSNFLLWQAAYAEYYAAQDYWPDFGRKQFYEALVSYSRRVRKFGGLSSNQNGESKA
jgi:undecaprenyl diphosphate synthase